ncbi:unnamed protein product [Ilex paraguariensis]|uniref:Uncharacterized protein n=1 Tax=Ilex paraguariensis TaxID=185542 RepID=A0ABC8S1F8_9AQUA
MLLFATLKRTQLFVLSHLYYYSFLEQFMAMAIELCSENSGLVMSPRISFSHDLSQSDVVPVEYLTRSSSSSSIDFDFCVFRESFDQESSSADELFSDGMILPFEIKKKISPQNHATKSPPPPSLPHPSPPLPHPSPPSPRQGTHDRLDIGTNTNETKMASSESEEKQNSKSFWRFKRSSSLNCGSGYGGGLCPLPLLSRSNSTGSAQSVKRSSFSKESANHKQHSQKIPWAASVKQSQSSSSTGYQKPPLKKGYGSYGHGVRINPVLNVPTANLFGLGSIFSPLARKRVRKSDH